ncbi:MAG: hypothetical protein GY710_12980, partial [Desulfobacteraceae bacterium]|nr:hypothetical protein [Desulfobacteraceae bacterium]
MHFWSLVILLLSIITGLGTIILFWYEKHKPKEEQNPKLILFIGITVLMVSLLLHPVISCYEKSTLPKSHTAEEIADKVVAKLKGYEKELQG